MTDRNWNTLLFYISWAFQRRKGWKYKYHAPRSVKVEKTNDNEESNIELAASIWENPLKDQGFQGVMQANTKNNKLNIKSTRIVKNPLSCRYFFVLSFNPLRSLHLISMSYSFFKEFFLDFNWLSMIYTIYNGWKLHKRRIQNMKQKI